jgi:hypothetical protein
VGEMKAQLDGLRTNTKSPLRVHHAKSPHDLVHNVESLYLIYRERLQKFEEGVEELVERGHLFYIFPLFSIFSIFFFFCDCISINRTCTFSNQNKMQ